MLTRDDLHGEIARLRRENELLVEQVRTLKDKLKEITRSTTAFPKSWQLRSGEAKVLASLYTSSPSSFRTRRALHLTLYDGAHEPLTSEQIINVLMTRVRKVLPPGSIETVWGEGYKLTPQGRAFIDASVAGRNAEAAE